ncbi:MAG: hypothetical protein PVI30_01925 [Myxococcales bacterium]|jgi:hypothetical protein
MQVWQWLQEAGAHNDVVQWARPFEEDFERLWRECPRGDWLLAIAVRLDAERPALVQAACRCARLSLVHLPEDDPRPAAALQAAEAWSAGQADPDALERQREALAGALDAAVDPAGGAAMVSLMSALDAVDDPEAAVNAAAFASQAAVLDAGDCAMMEALRFTQRRGAQLVREAIDGDRALSLWQAR